MSNDAWICPRCQKVWAWWVPGCNCPPPSVSVSTRSTPIQTFNMIPPVKLTKAAVDELSQGLARQMRLQRRRP